MARVVLLTRQRSESKYLALELQRAGCLSAIVLERSPIVFRPARLRRPSLRSAEGKNWIRMQLRQNFGITLALEPARILYDQLAWRLADTMENHLTSFCAGDACWYSDQSLTFPDSVPRHEVDNLNDPSSIALLTSLAPDIFLVVGTRVLDHEVVRIPRMGTLNWHPGILPDYRGVYCELFALYNQDFKNVGYTIHYIDAGVDSGDIVWRSTVPVLPNDDIYTLRAKSAIDAAKVLPGLFESIEAGRIPRSRQVELGRQYFMRDVVPSVRIKVIVDGLLRRWRVKELPHN